MVASVIQTAAKIVIEPIFEADFKDNAYGYRPARGAMDAVKASTLTGMDPGVLKLTDPLLARANSPCRRSPSGKRGPGDSPLSRPQPP
jgi:hypothetical protein